MLLNKRVGLTVHLLKADVEGFENFAFMGGTKLLQSGKVSNIIMENSSTEKSHVVSVFDLIYQSGYKVHSLLTVTGDPYNNTTVRIKGMNEAVSMISSNNSTGEFGESLDFLVKVTCNVWLVKR